jgi:tRNA(Ile)-lysidine synthase
MTGRGLLEVVAKRLREAADWDGKVLRFFPADHRYLVGVSGGRDSVALLHWLAGRGYRKLIVCHLNHRLRGHASAADARFVERLATHLGFGFIGAEKDVKALARSSSHSIETAARFARYEFLASVARLRRCSTIFLGHHADDLVETYLMNLFRGAGGGGRTMRAISEHVVAKTRLTVVRPLLDVWRTEIDRYVASEGLRFREDASNASLDPTRNRLRHRVIPALEKQFGRSIRKTVWRAAAIAAEENALIESLVPAALQRCEKLSVRVLRQQPIALQRRVIRDWLREHDVADIGFEVIERVRALIEADSRTAKANVTEDRHVRRRAGELFIESARTR